MQKIEIIEYSDQYKDCFKALNDAWISKYFWVEPTDEYVLCNPVEAILEKGGYIFFARQNDTIVGTCALMKVEPLVYELGKMAVEESCRGLGIGTMLMKTVIAKAKKMKLRKLVLYSNTRLHAAINMYIRFGFYLVPKTDFHNHRANMKMELKLMERGLRRSFKPKEQCILHFLE
jgi:N-acetylglutamate synthase-like GNAT family acetyltransferase